MGSLKLLQDLHNKNKISQTRFRFIFCLFLFFASSPQVMYFLRMVYWIYETYGAWCSVWGSVARAEEGLRSTEGMGQ
ncbi:MAG: hypothetical protein D4R81_07605 [Nitrospiraceae bacterium]|nr:MAG: hypothetical protein D4R81_07605 [Nitrospiraceae bacterium]